MTTAAPTRQISRITVAEPLDPPGQHGRIGLVALATDVNSESDLRRLAPEGVEIYTNRVSNANPATVENLRAMAGDISRTARGILPGDTLDVLIYGCTAGTVVIGEEEVMRRLRARQADISCTTPVTAAKAAFAAFGARKLSILTPYIDSVNREVLNFFEDQGFEVVNIAGFGLADDNDMTAVTPHSIQQAALEVCDPAADLLFISCTALRSAQIVAATEAALGKPVITSNQALMWHALELIGTPYRLDGFGALFQRRLGA